MRRIYESRALDRNDENPFQPSEGDSETEPQAMRTVPSTTLSRMLVPNWLRFRALSVTVSTPKRAYEPGETVPFVVELRNALPIPVSVSTPSPLLWTWHVDGHTEASHLPQPLPDDGRTFDFGRGERKRFSRRWEQSFRVSESEWEPADPGEYTIGAALNVEGSAERGLSDETTVVIR